MLLELGFGKYVGTCVGLCFMLLQLIETEEIISIIRTSSVGYNSNPIRIRGNLNFSTNPTKGNRRWMTIGIVNI